MAILGVVVIPAQPGPPRWAIFKADRPFHFVIKSANNNLSLFIGTVSELKPGKE